MSTTVRLAAAHVPHVRQILLYDLPGETLDSAETREKIAEIRDQINDVLERLDRLGWDDDRDRDYTDEPERLANLVARLIDRGADQAGLVRPDPFEEATCRREAIVPALAGVSIFDQLEQTRNVVRPST